MFLHIGSGVSVKAEQIVCVIDLESGTTAAGTKDYMKKMQASGSVKQVGDELPRSLIVTGTKDSQICHVSPISVRTLKARMDELEVKRNWKKKS